MPVIRAGTLSGGTLKGTDHGASISLILDESEPGQGPRLHRHPYDETWVVQEGHLTFQCGEELLIVRAGDIVIVPPGVAHKFTNDGWPRSLQAGVHPRQPDLHRRVARVIAWSRSRNRSHAGGGGGRHSGSRGRSKRRPAVSPPASASTRALAPILRARAPRVPDFRAWQGSRDRSGDARLGWTTGAGASLAEDC